MNLNAETLILILNTSIQKNGAIPLTNLHLRNILSLAAKQQEIDLEKEEKFQEERSAILSVLGETDYSEVDIPQRIYELRNKSREYFHANTRLNARIEQLDKFAAACHKIYIARNITFDEKLLLDAFKEIDVLLKDKNEN